MSVPAEWLWGWDPTPGIVSVWAEASGHAQVWRRLPESGALVHEPVRFRPWLLLDRLDDLRAVGAELAPDGDARGAITYRELEGPGALRFHVSGPDGRALTRAVLDGASRRLGRRVGTLRDLGPACVLALSPEEQYLVASGRTYFRDLAFDQLHRLQFDLETTGLDPARHRMFMVAVRHPDGREEVLEAAGSDDAAEADLIRRLVASVTASDPDVIENHNLLGFDLPFLVTRARMLRVPLGLGRLPQLGVRERASRREQVRHVLPGRECIDTLDAVRRYDFAVRELPGHGLKAVARHFGIAAADRELVPGDQVYATWRRDPERVRRYATADVVEVAALARLLGGAAYALAQLAPRRYERLADAGAATGVIDPMLVRAYLRAGHALPVHEPGDGTVHSGAALHLFATGVAERVVKADVASLYPSLMRTHRIGPRRDRLGAMLAMVDGLVGRRLAAKEAAKGAAPGSTERFTHEAMSAAMKLVVNTAYGYLAAGGLTRFADVHAANEVTRRGRETLDLLCRELHARGVTRLEADTDGVYFAVPAHWSEADERRVVSEVGALLPPLVQLEFEGRYAAMLSHEPKNYALLGYDGKIVLRGVAFRSSRAEPFAEAFLRRAVGCLLAADVPGVRAAYVDTVMALRRRGYSTYEVSSRVRLTKSAAQYAATRSERREHAYEALLAAGRRDWRRGERVRVYRAGDGSAGLVHERPPGSGGPPDERRYDVEHYLRVLKGQYAARLARAFEPHDAAALFADPGQESLFPVAFEHMRAVLRES
ncbi:MAG: ribonuclease H-like domain-containing protein [Candidatus Eisenbacteria bacterium]